MIRMKYVLKMGVTVEHDWHTTGSPFYKFTLLMLEHSDYQGSYKIHTGAGHSDLCLSKVVITGTTTIAVKVDIEFKGCEGK